LIVRRISPEIQTDLDMEKIPTENRTSESGSTSGIADDLLLKDRALNVAAEGITIADMRMPGQPLIYINEGFERLTGYSAKSMLGKNCRFLQGEDTDPATVREIRDAIAAGKECSVEILNYTKNGEPFWNRLSLTPILNPDGEVTHFIGIQSDISKRRNAEEELQEVNRKLEMTNRHIKRSLEAAAKIQRALLPDKEQRFEGIGFSYLVQPCDELGGDTLNVIGLDPSRVAVYTVDVSGHGVPASLLSTTLSHWFSRVLNRVPGSFSFSLVELAEELNRQFQMGEETAQYFTMCFGIIDLKSQEFRYVAAGNPPLVVARANGTMEVLEVEGFPVGLLEQAWYSENVIKLTGGDRVFLYTDGVIEAENDLEIAYGTANLIAQIEKNRGRSLNDCIGSILESVTSWDGFRGLKDDCSILAFELAEQEMTADS